MYSMCQQLPFLWHWWMCQCVYTDCLAAISICLLPGSFLYFDPACTPNNFTTLPLTTGKHLQILCTFRFTFSPDGSVTHTCMFKSFVASWQRKKTNHLICIFKISKGILAFACTAHGTFWIDIWTHTLCLWETFKRACGKSKVINKTMILTWTWMKSVVSLLSLLYSSSILVVYHSSSGFVLIIVYSTGI